MHRFAETLSSNERFQFLIEIEISKKRPQASELPWGWSIVAVVLDSSSCVIAAAWDGTSHTLSIKEHAINEISRILTQSFIRRLMNLVSGFQSGNVDAGQGASERRRQEEGYLWLFIFVTIKYNISYHGSWRIHHILLIKIKKYFLFVALIIIILICLLILLRINRITLSNWKMLSDLQAWKIAGKYHCKNLMAWK